MIFKKNISIEREMLDNYSFILVAEGINYKSEIRINNNFITNHIGGFTSIVSPILYGTLTGENEIVINVNSELTYNNTLPLANQVNYSKVYGGINKDIYLLAVPRVHISRYKIEFNIDPVNLSVTNIIDVQSSVIASNDTAASYSIQTKFLNQTTGEEIASSERTVINLTPNSSGKFINQLTISNPVYWSPANPNLYGLKILIYSGETVIDEFNSEMGFAGISKHNNDLIVNGQPFKIKGINYYEDSPRFASALDYSEVESDLRNIKNLGFNLVRVPGKSAHPYIVSLCNLLGLFLMQEIPFNDVPESLVADERYRRLGLDNLADIVIRDRNNPAIIGWGIGNDFFAESQEALDYLRNAKGLIDSTGKKFIYYTSRFSNKDIISAEVDFVGINIYDAYLNDLQNISDNLKSQNRIENRANRSLFISRIGININNNNSNGYSDPASLEAQAKFLTEGYKLFAGNTNGVIMSSYADWNSERPLNYPFTLNPYIQTDGIYNFYREQKRSPEFIKRILHDEELPRINEGSFTKEFPYIFIITGIFFIILFLYFINHDRKFRKSIGRSFYKVQYFFYQLKEMLIIPYGYNILLTILISVGIALFFSSIIYYFKVNSSFDMILANFFTNDSLKIWFSHNSNNNYILIGLFTLLNILFTLFIVLFIYIFTFYSKGKFYLKNIYTIVVWASLPLIFCLLMGTVILKLAESNPSYIRFSLIIFAALFVIYLIRLIKGIKVIYEIKSLKAYLYGSLVIVLIFGIIYYYFLFFTSAIHITRLVLYLN